MKAEELYDNCNKDITVCWDRDDIISFAKRYASLQIEKDRGKVLRRSKQQEYLKEIYEIIEVEPD